MAEENYEDYLPTRVTKKDPRSALLIAKERARGAVVNACPFACEEGDLDARTFCPHLVGFTVPGDSTRFFARVWRQDADGNDSEFEYVEGESQPVQKGDRLVKISVAYRVYRDVEGRQKKAKARELAGAAS